MRNTLRTYRQASGKRQVTRLLIMLGWGMASLAAVAAPLFDPGNMASSAPAVCRLDTRSSFGGRLARGELALNTTGAEAGTELALDGVALGTVASGSFLWNTAAYADGPHVLALGAVESGVDILNDPEVVIHGGRLDASETWDAAHLHIVRNWVVVPSGVTLTIEAGAVVKFCRYTRLHIEPGGVVVAIGTTDAPIFFTHVADATLGGEANPDVGDVAPALDDYDFDVRGTLTLSPYTQVRYRSSVPGYPQISIGDRLVDETEGTVQVPVSLSAAAPTAIRVSWRTEDGTATAGQDYVASSGVLTWAEGQSERQFITVPLNKVGENKPRTETFFVQLEDPYAATFARDRATVWIMDNTMAATDTGELAYVVVESQPCRLDLRDVFSAWVVQGMVDLRYEASWREGAVAVQVSIDGTTVAEGVDGTFSWNTTLTENGAHALALTWVDGAGAEVDTTSVTLFVINNAILHRGRITADETWAAGSVHIVLDPVIVGAGVTLNIEPGAVVKFCDGAGLIVEAGGTAIANGVIFTHIADDSVGGDSNCDGNATLPALDAYSLTGNMVTDAATQLRFTSQTVSGTFSTNQTWMSGRTYKVTGNITVASGATLTILPGAVVKMGDKLSIIVNSGGALSALGNRVLPIIFTSIKDDTYGGDSNGDGNLTQPQPGDWGAICNNGGAVTIEHARIQYGGWGQYANWGDGMVRNKSGTLRLACCELRGALLRLVAANAGTVQIENSILRDGRWGVDGTATVINSIIHDCENSLVGTGTAINSVLIGCANTASSGYSLRYCNIWQAGNPRTGNGNLAVNPLFVDAERGDYRLQDGSPLIDAGDGAAAPELDYFGRPRMDVRTVLDTGTLAANGACPDIGIYEAEGEVTMPRPDLIAVSVFGEASAIAGKTMTVDWEVGNVGVAEAVGPRRDVVWLAAADPLLGSQTVKLGEHVAAIPVPVGGTQTCSAAFTLPPLSPGLWKYRIHVNAYRDVFEAQNVTNNIGLSEGTLTVASPVLGLGTSEVAVAPGESAGFRLDGLPAAGGTLMVTAGPGVRVFAAAGYMPSADRHQWTATELGDGRLLLTIPPGFAADGLFLALVNDTAVPVNVSVDVRPPVRELFGVSRNQFPNTGEAVFTTFGTGWSNAATARLVLGGASIPASSLVCVGSEVRLVFAVQGSAPGVYDLVVEEGADRHTLVGAIELTSAGRGPEWYCDLVLQDASRAGRECAGRFTYGNRGDTEMPAPYVRIFSESGNILVKFDTKDYWQSGSLEFMAGSATWPASMLKPGESRSVEFRYYIVPNASDATSLRYTFTTASEEGYPWDANAASMRPSWMSDEMWRFTLAAMRDRIGETWNDWLECMRTNMDYLAEMGQPTQHLAPLWQIEINGALNADGPLSTLASATDARRAGRGMAVAFSRWYGAAIHQRFQDGILGYGWTHNYDIRLERQNYGQLVRIRYPGGSERVFEKIEKAPPNLYYVDIDQAPRRTRSSVANVKDGGGGRRSESHLTEPVYTYWSPVDTNDRGRYWESSDPSLAHITESDGSQFQFDLASGRLLSVSNGRGQTLTLTYSGALLSRVTHSDGQFLEFAYAAGRLASVTDDAGRGVHYSYTGAQLSSVAASDGLVTSYTYNNAPSSVLDKALTQVAFPDGTTLDFAYDYWGAVEAVSRNGTEQTVQYIWEGAGVYSIIDNAGGVSRVWRGARGEVLAISDPLGRHSRYSYDATTHRLIAITAPGGERATITYDNNLHPVRTVNPSGFATEFTYNWRGDLTSVTDARGQRLNYRYDGPWGRLSAITYPDSSVETYTSADNGDVLGFRNRRAQDIFYEYDARGRTTRKEMPDGRVFTYTYDAKGNLTKATDSLTGAITLDYDAAERLSAITYPDGRGFTYTYDAAGRRASRTAQDGHQLVYEYDARGRFVALTDGTRNVVIRYTYDDTVGRLVRQDFGNGTYSTFAYDLAGQLTGLAHYAADGTPLEQITYTYDVNGRRNSMTTSAGSHAYRYDATGQLLGVTSSDGANESFAYDPVGNRLAANGSAYTVNALNQYTAVGTATFTYDADGNLATSTDADGTTTYTYDAENRLVGVTRPDSATWTCTYDALGNRVEVNDNGTVSRYVFDPVGLTDLAAEYDAAGSLVRRYLHAGWLAADETADGARRYYHADALSSTRLLTDDSGIVVATRDYSAFGQLKTATGEETPFGYVGGLGVLADSTGLLHTRNRDYAPSEGRFIQLDPIGINAGDVNLYRYCGNEPVFHSDPMGLWTVCISIPLPVPAGFDACAGTTAEGSVAVSFGGSVGPGSGGLYSPDGHLDEGWYAQYTAGFGPIAGSVTATESGIEGGWSYGSFLGGSLGGGVAFVPEKVLQEAAKAAKEFVNSQIPWPYQGVW